MRGVIGVKRGRGGVFRWIWIGEEVEVPVILQREKGLFRHFWRISELFIRTAELQNCRISYEIDKYQVYTNTCQQPYYSRNSFTIFQCCLNISQLSALFKQ